MFNFLLHPKWCKEALILFSNVLRIQDYYTDNFIIFMYRILLYIYIFLFFYRRVVAWNDSISSSPRLIAPYSPWFHPTMGSHFFLSFYILFFIWQSFLSFQFLFSRSFFSLFYSFSLLFQPNGILVIGL